MLLNLDSLLNLLSIRKNAVNSGQFDNSHSLLLTSEAKYTLSHLTLVSKLLNFTSRSIKLGKDFFPRLLMGIL